MQVKQRIQQQKILWSCCRPSEQSLWARVLAEIWRTSTSFHFTSTLKLVQNFLANNSEFDSSFTDVHGFLNWSGCLFVNKKNCSVQSSPVVCWEEQNESAHRFVPFSSWKKNKNSHIFRPCQTVSRAWRPKGVRLVSLPPLQSVPPNPTQAWADHVTRPLCWVCACSSDDGFYLGVVKPNEDGSRDRNCLKQSSVLEQIFSTSSFNEKFDSHMNQLDSLQKEVGTCVSKFSTCILRLLTWLQKSSELFLHLKKVTLA